MIPFTLNSTKYKLIASDKQVSDCLETDAGRENMRRAGKRDYTEGHQETFRNDEYMHYLVRCDGFTTVYL